MMDSEARAATATAAAAAEQGDGDLLAAYTKAGLHTPLSGSQ
jgi:hypothetical protein